MPLKESALFGVELDVGYEVGALRREYLKTGRKSSQFVCGIVDIEKWPRNQRSVLGLVSCCERVVQIVCISSGF